MCSYLDVVVEDLRSVNRTLDVIGRDGTLKLHLPGGNPHYVIW